MLESADIVDLGLVFFKSCHPAEGDSHLIITAGVILSLLEASTDSDFETKNITQVLNKTRILTIECNEPFLDEEIHLWNFIEACKLKVEGATIRVIDLLKKRNNLTSSVRSSRRRVRTMSQRVINNDYIELFSSDIT